MRLNLLVLGFVCLFPTLSLANYQSTRQFKVDWSAESLSDSATQMCDEAYIPRAEILIPISETHIENFKNLIASECPTIEIKDIDWVFDSKVNHARFRLEGIWGCKLNFAKPSDATHVYVIELNESC
ncbi:MAG TPA: hypothetical protein PKD85_10920 [Saprospiraceae bacterium]|nr:hypothetical protein [Saprospiraceae bacterium]